MDQYLVFLSNGEKLAINIDSVDKIIEYKEPHKIPNDLEFILGVIQYNDKALSLVDITNKLYGIEFIKTPNTKVVMVYSRNRYLALVVEDILGIRKFDKERYEQNNSYNKIEDQYIKGFIKINNNHEDIVIVIDVDKLFTEKELTYLDINLK